MCILVFVIRVPEFQKTNSDQIGKERTKSVVILWDNFSKFWDQICQKKLNDEHFEKINIKIVITYILMSNYSLFVEFQIVGPNFA